MSRAWMQTPVHRARLATLRGVIEPSAIRRQRPHHTARFQELGRHVAESVAQRASTPPERALEPTRHVRHR